MRSGRGEHLGIVTGERKPRLTDDGRALASRLGERGFRTEPVVWNDPSVDWSAFDAVVVRSCWEYYDDPAAFRTWLRTLDDDGVVALNPTDVIRWNVHKFYLRDLAAAGVSVVPTEYVEQGSEVGVETILDRPGWTEAVVKPAIGTGSTGVWRTTAPVGASDAAQFRELRSERDLLVQQFLPEIEDGELSFVFFAGEFSHAVRGVPAAGDFRVDPSHGSTTAAFDPPSRLVEQAAAVLDAAGDVLSIDPSTLAYARVDGVERAGEFALMELELVEPYLSLSTDEASVDRFVESIDGALRRSGAI